MEYVGWKSLPNKTTPLSAEYLDAFVNAMYPIGKVEIFYDNEDHSNYLGFTWVRTSVGKTPVGIDTTQDEFNTIGKTGGEKTHTLTIAEMPEHDHQSVNYAAGYGNNMVNVESGFVTLLAGVNASVHLKAVEATGGNQPHNNMPPYEVMALWRRTA